MRKIIIILVIAVLSLGLITSVITYSNATITNPAIIKIATSERALLAIAPGYGACSHYTKIDNGTLKVDFSDPGFSPDSTFRCNELFSVKNNSGELIKYTIINNSLPHVTISPISGYLYPGDFSMITINISIPGNTDSHSGLGGSLRVEAETQP